MSSSTTTKVCFNSSCKGQSEKWCRGWRCRTGEYAHLCDRCGAAYEEGRFCETFHINTPGWRCCESCGKQVHCGCIVSFHLFVLLDAGGIECLTCAKKTYILTPNPAWPPPSHFLPSQSERMKDLSGKTWSAFAGLGPVPWRQAPSVLNDSNFRTDVHPKVPFEIDVTGGIERFRTCERLSATSSKAKQKSYYETLVNGKAGLDPFETVRHGTSVSSKTKTDDTQPSMLSTPVGKHVSCYNGIDTSGETLTCNGEARENGQSHIKLLRYRPQITNEELQQISGDSKSAVTPMFEKMLTASDAGRIGRLVLPKKCAEAYFPPIAQPEGLPLKVQDAKGNEWVFQFRYWPNNNSRMYVLEGITPCIQSMQLQAGDIVTFSRVEPEGKLVIGGRKASIIPASYQGDKGVIMGSDSSVMRDDIGTKNCREVILMNCHMKGKSSNSIRPINEAQTGILEDKPVTHRKRKNVNLDTKTKRLKIENKVIIELNLTFNEAQGLMRPPANIVPSVVVVEGCEFEEFEEAIPVIGRPTIPGIDHFGEKIQWVQCEDCFRWRKVPADALLPSRWICSGNEWDFDRSLCSSAEELTTEQLEDFLNTIKEVSPEKVCTKQDTDVLVSQEGLNTLANLAIQEGPEGDGPEARTKHPRHKPNCACIVCLQPPSGQGLNHADSCECVVCSSLKRRFKTLMERREKKQLEKGAVSAIHVSDFDAFYRPNVGNSGVNKDIVEKDSVSPLKGKIDLNIKPDRDEEFSLGLDSKRMNGCLPGNQICSGSNVLEKVEEEELKQDEIRGSDFDSCIEGDGNSHKMD